MSDWINTSEFTKVFNTSFDTKTGLASLYLWILFGFLASMINCDFQRWINSNILFRHFVGIIGFFLLFSVITVDGSSPIGDVWLKTIFVYGIFLLMIKMKWYFSVPIFLILIVDQSMKVQQEYLKRKDKKDPSLKKIETVRNYFNPLICVLAIVGFSFYAIRQKNEFGKNFSWIKLLFHSTCKTK